MAYFDSRKLPVVAMFARLPRGKQNAVVQENKKGLDEALKLLRMFNAAGYSRVRRQTNARETTTT